MAADRASTTTTFPPERLGRLPVPLLTPDRASTLQRPDQPVPPVPSDTDGSPLLGPFDPIKRAPNAWTTAPAASSHIVWTATCGSLMMIAGEALPSHDDGTLVLKDQRSHILMAATSVTIPPGTTVIYRAPAFRTDVVRRAA